MRIATPFDARAYYYYYAAETRGCRAPAIFGGGFSPASQSPFAWYDPSDLTTLFQERTGASATTPSAVDGVVGTMLDKSGNGHHLVAPSDAARPILRNFGALYWLEFDGSDDLLAVDFDDFSEPVDYLVAWRTLTTEAAAYIVDCSVTNNQSSFQDNAGTARLFSGALVDGGSIAEETDYVATIHFDGAGGSRVALDNGSYATGNAGNAGVGGLTIGARGDGSQNIEMLFYGLPFFNRALTDPEIAPLRTYLAAKQGRVL